MKIENDGSVSPATVLEAAITKKRRNCLSRQVRRRKKQVSGRSRRMRIKKGKTKDGFQGSKGRVHWYKCPRKTIGPDCKEEEEG
jgi:hypothetical protein